ncbi:uncharacterized protein LOC124499236 isoform X2 [Dermatophagoides farinae]|uniref:uncharacterized protein LOC124499236 isoform X2 n=1 Tax=Dermatophagoides farinae TaxID=6954 RepID=UPI003F622732
MDPFPDQSKDDGEHHHHNDDNDDDSMNQTNDKGDKNLKSAPKLILSSETISEWTLVYSDSNSSIFDSSSMASNDEHEQAIKNIVDKNPDNDDDDDDGDNVKNITSTEMNDEIQELEKSQNDQSSNERRYSDASTSSIIVFNENDHNVSESNDDKCGESLKQNVDSDSRQRRSSIDRISTTTSLTSNSTANMTTTSDSETNSDDEVFVHSVHQDNNNPRLDHINKSESQNCCAKHRNESMYNNKHSTSKHHHQRSRNHNHHPHQLHRRRQASVNNNNQYRTSTNTIRRRRTIHGSQSQDQVSINHHHHCGSAIISPPIFLFPDQMMNPDVMMMANDDQDIVLVDKAINDVSLPVSSVLNGCSVDSNQFHEQYLVAKYDDEDQEHHADLSNSESDELLLDQYDIPLMNAKTGRIRAYFHKPNTVLNSKLNLALILSLAAVIGLGVGHFLGWSTLLNQQKQLSLAQVMKLKQLQDDLLTCMKDQRIQLSSEYTLDNDHHKVCVNDADYWTERFRSLFDENQGLKELFQKTQKNFAENRFDSILDDKEFNNKNTNEEFHKLKLDLLIKQMEHLKLLEVLEDIKSKGERSAKRVLVLEEENEDLKHKLEEEEQDDRIMAEDYNLRVTQLQEENQELRDQFRIDEDEDGRLINELQSKIRFLDSNNQQLRRLLKNLEQQISMHNDNDDDEPMIISMETNNNNKQNSMEKENSNEQDRYQSSSESLIVNENESYQRYDIVRQRINQLMLENEELKAKIARYRWTNSEQQQYKMKPSSSATASTINLNNDNDDDDRQQESSSSSSSSLSKQQLEQLKIRLTIMHRQLLLSREENQKLRNRNEHLAEQNKLLTLKLKKRNMDKFFNRGVPRHDSVSSSSSSSDDYDFEINDDDNNYNDDDDDDGVVDDNDSINNDDNENNHGNQIWSSFMDQMSDNYYRWSKKLKKHGANLDGTSFKLFNYGKELMQSTMDGMQKISKQLLDSYQQQKQQNHNNKKNSPDMMKYFTDRINDFSSMIEKGLQSTVNEFKSVINSATTIDPNVANSNTNNNDNNNNDNFRENRKKEKRMKKLRKKFLKQQQQINKNDDEFIINNNNDNEQSSSSSMKQTEHDWSMDRAESREKARLQRKQQLDGMENNIDWQSRRAKLRAKSRKL